MKLLDIAEIESSPRTYLFLIQVDDDVFADVSCNTKTGLMFALEHPDGGIYYNHAGKAISYPMEEEELIKFVKRYTVKCTDIKYGTPIVFLTKNDLSLENDLSYRYMDGTTDIKAAHVKKIGVSWLDGYKSRDEFIPFCNAVAVYDESGFEMQFDNISGKSLIVIQ